MADSEPAKRRFRTMIDPVPTTLRVLLLARYGITGASSRVRHYSYLPGLAARGISVEVDALIDDDSIAHFYAGRMRRWDKISAAYMRRIALLRRLGDFDVVWVEKEALPGLPWQFESRFYQEKPTVVDLDDFWVARFKVPTQRETRKFRSLLAAATDVTAANAHLAAAIAAFSGRAPRVIENTIDVDQYRLAAQRDQLIGDVGRPCRIGWIGTPYTAAAYLTTVAPLLNRLTRENLAVTRLIGAGDAVPELKAERVPWSLATEADMVAGIDIGVMPLDQTAFAAGKSGWKLVQYMAAGRPVVGTRIGFNADLIDDGVTGFLVDDLAGFEQSLRQLANEPATRVAMGLRGQAAITRRFNRNAGLDAVAKVLRAAAGTAR
jgi:glycosyltransferase involved in cell wall biosynthesis